MVGQHERRDEVAPERTDPLVVREDAERLRGVREFDIAAQDAGFDLGRFRLFEGAEASADRLQSRRVDVDGASVFSGGSGNRVVSNQPPSQEISSVRSRSTFGERLVTATD
jgi:hypothetical protein